MKMFNAKKGGAKSGMKMYFFIMLCAVGAMVWTFVTVGEQASRHQSRMTDVSEQLIQSQRIAKYALAATTGDDAAFGKMAKSKQAFSGILKKQKTDFGPGESPESRAMANLDKNWNGFRSNIDAVLEGRVLISAMAESTSLMSEVMPQLMEHTQDVTNTLVKQGASSKQVKLASNQSVLGQRIVNSMNDVMRGKDTEAAAILFAADTKEFGRVLDGFMRGTGGIKQLQGKTLKSKLQKIALLFSRVSDNAGAIVENADELVTIQAAATGITGQSEVLFLSLIHISEPTRRATISRMPSSA